MLKMRPLSNWGPGPSKGTLTPGLLVKFTGFLVYDIRKGVVNLELWPQEIIQMTGNRIKLQSALLN